LADTDGYRRALQRGQAWPIVKEASERANVRVLALRASSMVRLARLHQFTRTCSVMREFARRFAVRATWGADVFCGKPPATCPLPSAKLVGAASRWRI